MEVLGLRHRNAVPAKLLGATRRRDDPSVPPRGDTMHIFLLLVDERFYGRGSAQGLVRACLAIGEVRGYRTAVVEATGRVSQHVFDKLAFVSRATVSYADYRRDGIAVFASIEEHGGPIAMHALGRLRLIAGARRGASKPSHSSESSAIQVCALSELCALGSAADRAHNSPDS
jgi:GNAT superfamily N-acetyltransferase